MANLIGTKPNQVPVNGMLGTAAFIDADQLPVSVPQAAAIALAGGGVGVTWKSATLNFGTVPVYSKALTISDAAATTSSKINVVHAPTNDEAEMDAVVASAVCLVNGTITVYAHALPGPITGNRNFNYFLG